VRALREFSITRLLIISCSIAYGVIAGILSYLLLNGVPWIITRLTGGRIIPPNIEMSEEWVIPPGGMIPMWMCVLNFLFL
jgi:AGZA family xanthine/uracil permease-like MFS transporter